MKRKAIMNILRLADPVDAAIDLPLEDRRHIVEVVEEMRDIVEKTGPHPMGFDPIVELGRDYTCNTPDCESTDLDGIGNCFAHGK